MVSVIFCTALITVHNSYYILQEYNKQLSLYYILWKYIRMHTLYFIMWKYDHPVCFIL